MNRLTVIGACIVSLLAAPVGVADSLEASAEVHEGAEVTVRAELNGQRLAMVIVVPPPPIDDECTHQITGATIGFFTDLSKQSVFGDTAVVIDQRYRAIGQFSGGSVVSSPVGNVYQYVIVNGYVDRADYCF